MSGSVQHALFSFKERLARAPFWWWCMSLWLAFAIGFVFLQSALGRPATWILYPPFVWILGALVVKRLHDWGASAWQALWLLLPVIGPLWLIVSLGFRAGTEGDNQYGADPRLENVDYLKVDTP